MMTFTILFIVCGYLIICSKRYTTLERELPKLKIYTRRECNNEKIPCLTNNDCLNFCSPGIKVICDNKSLVCQTTMDSNNNVNVDNLLKLNALFFNELGELQPGICNDGILPKVINVTAKDCKCPDDLELFILYLQQSTDDGRRSTISNAIAIPKCIDPRNKKVYDAMNTFYTEIEI